VRELRPLGAFFVTDDLPTVGKVGRVEFPARSDETAFSIECRVVHIRPNSIAADKPRGFAVKFEPANAEQSKALNRALVAPAGDDAADQKITANLRRMPIFANLAGDELDKIKGIVREVKVAADAVVLCEGDPADSFYIVKAGAVKIIKGDPPHELAVLKDGDFFGEMGVLLGAPRSATVVTLGPTELYRVDESDWFALLGVNRVISDKIQSTMIRRYAENVSAVFSERLQRELK
jgi:hypothetical protein